MGAAGLHHRGELLLALCDHAREVMQRGQQLFVQQQRRADVDRGRNDIVAALPHVDMIVGMHRQARARGQVSDHLVGVHVGTGARTGLKHVDRKLRVVRAAGHLLRSALNGLGDVAREQPQLRIGGRGGPLDQRDGANEATRQGQSADGKILDGTLRLRAPQRLGGDIQFTHAVAFDTKRWRAHAFTQYVMMFSLAFRLHAAIPWNPPP